jgi:hypothetical protein
MAVTKANEYQIGVNNDIGNLANNVDLNRIGADLTALELDGGTVKVSVGSIIESQGSLYKVDTAAVTPTGTATAGAYLFFDDSVPGFVWSSTAGTYDPARGGIYDASARRQCRFYLTSSTEWLRVVADDGNDIRHEGALTVEGAFVADGLTKKIVDIGDWNMNATSNVIIAHGISDFTGIRSVNVLIRDDSFNVLIPFSRDGGSGADGFVGTINSTGISLFRRSAGGFTTSAFDGTGFNRGWIIFEYLA